MIEITNASVDYANKISDYVDIIVEDGRAYMEVKHDNTDNK